MMKFGVLVFFLGLYIRNVNSEVCPTHKEVCPESAMCCIQKDGSYGCCPYKDGHCCPDKIHCCPVGTRCNVKLQSCDSTTLGIKFRWMVPVYDYQVFNKPTRSEGASDIQTSVNTCPDGTSCPSSASCCQMPGGSYGCCPYRNANCCSDKEHCCPNDYVCDLQNHRCIPQSLGTKSNFWKKSKYLPIFNIRTNNFEVMSSSNVCPESNFCKHLGLICCETEGVQYCCPPGLACSQKEMCAKEIGTRISAVKSDLGKHLQENAASVKREDHPVICPDKTEACPAENTCCKMADSRYGCCPMPQATCCPDLLHCCPHGYICSDGGCQKKPFIHLLDQPNFVHLTAVKHKTIDDTLN